MIPLTIPHLNGNEWEYVRECIETGWVSSAGAYVDRFEKQVAAYAGCQYGVACVNGTSGLHLAMHLHGIGQGDCVIVPNLTFIASVNAVVYTSAAPIFIDIDPDTWQIDLDLLEEFLETQTEARNGQTCLRHHSQKIRAIMPVHVLGNMCDMERLVDLAAQYHLTVIEDASEALGTRFRAKHAGAFGKMGVFSFNGNKIITTGGGGVVVTDDAELAERAKHLTTQAKADPQRYFHDEIGFNYRLVNVLAAIGVAQMEQLDTFVQKKKWIDAYYREHLNGVGDIRFQHITAGVDPNCWLFTFRSERRDQILKRLQENNILARPFWVPMNQLPMFSEATYIRQSDHAAAVHQESVSIPSSLSLSEENVAEVVRVIKTVF
mgnify:CR=1 FL=1